MNGISKLKKSMYSKQTSLVGIKMEIMGEV